MGSASATEAELELERLLGQTERPRSRAVLTAELERRRAARTAAASAAAASAAATPPTAATPSSSAAAKPAAPTPKPATAPSTGEFSAIANYAWDHSNKFVKVYLTLPGLSQLSDEQIDAQFAERSLRLSVKGLSTPPANRRLVVGALCAAVKPELCSWARKASDTLLIKLRKAEDGAEWGSLDDSSAKKETERKGRADANQARTRPCRDGRCLRISLPHPPRSPHPSHPGRASRPRSSSSRCTRTRTKMARSRSPRRGRRGARSARARRIRVITRCLE